MKRVQKTLAIILLTFSITTNVHAWGAKRPVETTPTPTPAPTIPVPPTTPVPDAKGPYLDQIKDLARTSSCASYSWKNRGRAPAGYINGMALSFAKGLCRLNAESPLAKVLSQARSMSATKDALTHYQTNISSLSINTSSAGVEPLRALYVLGIGLGMRESSGKYCEGWDRSASAGRPSSAGEAGIFQTSYDSIGASPELSKLYSEYKADKSKCYMDVFKEGASCSSNSNLGTGAGADYQSFNKACPAFATEYAMVMLRVLRTHYGPINRKEAEVIPECNLMLQNIQALFVNDPYACDDLL